MGIFDLFKRKPKFNDAFFCDLGYTTFKDSSKNFYDGEVKFQDTEIGIIINADRYGPTLEQKEFFKKLDDNYLEIKEKIILPLLRKKLEHNIKDSGLENFDSEFNFDGILIGKINNGKTEWSITYDSKPMKHYVSIDFIGMHPEYMTIDG